MTSKEIVNRRLKAQLLSGGGGVSAGDVVMHMGAMQAQDFAMSKWAIGVRTGLTEADVNIAIDAGAIIRTHLMRPTWHLVSAADVRWMLALTAPNVKRAYMGYGKKMGMDEKTLEGYCRKIARMLAKGEALTRDEIMVALKISRENETDFRPSLIMMHAEQEALVCNGPMKGKEITYQLMDLRVPKRENVKREEALARLAFNYFNSHGPATVADFAWWSGLGVNDARRGAAAASRRLDAVTKDGRTWFFTDHGVPEKKEIHFLPAFDEYLVSYKDREAAIGMHHQPLAFTKNGIFKPVIVDGGNVVGTWKRTSTSKGLNVEASLFSPSAAKAKKAPVSGVADFADFCGKEFVFTSL